MAAEAAVSSAVQILGNLLVRKVNFLGGVEGEVQWLKDELKRMQCFLKDAAKKQADDHGVRNWISEIREVAKDAEDAIEMFILKVENARRRRGLLGSWVSFLEHVYHVNKAGREIESLRTRLQDIRRSFEMYQIQADLVERSVNPYRRRSDDVEWKRRLAFWQHDKDVVGLKKDVELLLEKAILEKREGLSIATIVGMGGIGKSTLAGKIYNHPDVAKRFECRAWVVVSSEFTPVETIKQVMVQLQNSEDDKKKVLEDIKQLADCIIDKLFLQEKLEEMLHTQLEGKAYFIVLDDVWEDTHWESLKSAFPHQQDKASRLLVTSRNKLAIKHAQYVHEMKLLDPDSSWDLLLKKTFIDNTDGKCPQGLEYIGRNILEKCNGLPLAISVVGGLLSEQRQSTRGWQKVLDGITSHLGSVESDVSAILELSYQNLPPHLKSCFLSFGFFKEDAIVQTKKLVHIWIALDLVLQEEVGGEETMEDIARCYLDELINRNLVQIQDMKMDNQIKTCQIHDLLRELSIRKAEEEINLEILREESSQSSRKPRHRAMYCSGGRFVDSTDYNKHVRSLFVHGSISHDPSSSYWKSFELLRILDLQDSGLKELSDAIGALTGLRYLNLRDTRIKKLPHSLRNLENLQIFDLRETSVDEIPNFIWKMKSLRVLKVWGVRLNLPVKVRTPKNFQTLDYVSLRDSTIELLTQMTSLRKLGIDLHKISNVSKLFTLLVMMENLVDLRIRRCGSLNMDGLGTLHSITKLKLVGGMSRLPSANNFPPNLSYLSFSRTSLEEDPMPVLEKLPNLLDLKLDHAYRGGEMVISHDGFPRLKRLYVVSFWSLKDIKVEEGAVPHLQRWEIIDCPNLKIMNLPEHLRAVITLY